MYLPIVEPRPALWKRNSVRSHTLKSRPTSSNGSRAGGGQSSANSSRLFNDSMQMSVGSIGSGYGQPFSGENYTTIDDMEQEYEQYLERIRTFGYDYLKPPGIEKTMQAMIEEQEDFTDHDVDDEEAIEDNLLQQQEDSEFDNTTTTNVGALRMQIQGTPTGGEQQNQPALDMAAPQDLDGEGEGEEEEEDEEEEEVDLDADIAEASDHDYDDYDDYDEGDYAEGFMAEEESQQPQQPDTQDDEYDSNDEYDDENELDSMQQRQMVDSTPDTSAIVNQTALQQIEIVNDNAPLLQQDALGEDSDSDEEEMVFTYDAKEKKAADGEGGSGSGSDSESGDMSF